MIAAAQPRLLQFAFATIERGATANTIWIATTLVVALVAATESAAQGHRGYYCGSDSACPRDTSAGSVIVFVHGVGGDAKGTWTSQDGVFWPALVRLPGQDLSRSNVYIHEYDSAWLGKTSSIEELAKITKTQLENAEVFSHRVILFVTHSLGGLVVNEALRLRGGDPAKTIHVMSLGTPWKGADRALLETAVGSGLSATIKKYLSRVVNEAAVYKPSPAAGVAYTCLWERDGLVAGQRVVEEASATGHCASDAGRYEVNGDHIAMAKPRSVSDRQHSYLVSLFRSIGVPKGSPMTTSGYSYRWPPVKRWDPKDQRFYDQSGGMWIMCGLVQTFQAEEPGQIVRLESPVFNNTGTGRVFAKLYRLPANEWSDKRQLLWTLPTPVAPTQTVSPWVLPVNTPVELEKGSWYAMELYETGATAGGNANVYHETWGDFFPGRLYSKTNGDGSCGDWGEVAAKDIGFSVWVRR